jgi:hypothetical protein
LNAGQNADDQNGSKDPERTRARKKRLTEDSQVVGVGVEGLRPGENLQVAVHVGQ